ncbi:MAG: histidine kinase [Saprospiraceae bacterium]|nr:histidine kinase [Saprospiraceae bacterium]
MKISSLHIDRRGYLWIGTRNGLNKFDGEKFTVYTESDGLLHNRIHEIKEDTAGNLVILTYNGVCIFNGEKFTSYPKAFTSVVFDLAVDRNNSIWVCERYSNSALYELRNGKYYTVVEKKGSLVFQYDKPNDRCLLLSEGNIYEIRNNTLRIVNNAGYFIYVGNSDLESKALFMNDSFQDNRSLAYFKLMGDQMIPVATMDNININRGICDLQENMIWSSFRNKLYLPDLGSGRIIFQHEFSITHDVEIDAFNQFWIGSENGLAHTYSNAFYSVPVNQVSNVWTMLEDNENNIFFGTYGSGMFQMKSNSNKITSNKFSPYQNYFAGSAKDKDGRLYFATANGLEIHDGKQVRMLLKNKTVFSIYYDSKYDRIILGVTDGVYILKQPDSLKYFGIKEGIHENHYIQNIGCDKNGDFWLGSYTGVSKLNIETGVINNYTFKNSKLPCQGVYCSLLDSKSNFWLGGDNGLMYYDYNMDSILPVKSDVLHSMVKSMIELDNNKLLLATKDGLYILDTDQFLKSGIPSFQSYNASNGYLGIDPGFTGMYKDSKGFIWICSSTTVDRLDPSKLTNIDQQLGVKITHVNDQGLSFEYDKSILKILNGVANVVIRFDGIGFTRPLITKYQYRLNNGEWSEWQEESQVILKDLNSGTYKFEVRAGPTDKLPEHSKIDFMNFSVHLPFYRAAWFPPVTIGLTVFLLALSAIYFIRQRIERKRYESQLEEAKYLRSQLLLAQLNPHFIFNVLASIQHKVIFEKKEEASRNIVALSRLLRNFLTASYKGNNLTAGHTEYEIPLSTEIELLRAFVEFEHNKNDSHFEYYFEISPELNPDNHSLPPMLLQPFVENSIKHGLLLQKESGNLWVKFSLFKGSLSCVIEDDGIGIEKAQELQKNAFHTHESLGSKIIRERIELLNELGYNISIETKARIPKGTIVQIIIKEEE